MSTEEDVPISSESEDELLPTAAYSDYEEDIPFEEEIQNQIEDIFSENEKDILCGIGWICLKLGDNKYQFGNDFYDRLLQLIDNENEELSTEALRLIYIILMEDRTSGKYFTREGLPDFILSAFPSVAAAKVATALMESCVEARMTLIRSGFTEQVAMALESGSLSLRTLARLCGSFVAERIPERILPEFEPVAGLFARLLSLLLHAEESAGDEAAAAVAAAFSLWADAAEPFLKTIAGEGIFEAFLGFPSEHPDFVEQVLLMASSIARFSEELAYSLRARGILEYADHALAMRDWPVNALAAEVIGEVLFFVPQLSADIVNGGFLTRAIALLEQRPPERVVRAVARLATLAVGYIPASMLDAVASTGACNVAVDCAPLFSGPDAFFALTAINRVFAARFTLEWATKEGKSRRNPALDQWVTACQNDESEETRQLARLVEAVLRDFANETA